MEDQNSRAPRQPDLPKYAPVAFVVAIIAVLYSVYVFVHCAPMLQMSEMHVDQSRRLTGIVQLAVFHVLFVVMVASYVRCIFTSPGNIPETEEWEFSQREDCGALNQQETKRSGDRRHCKWCGKYKPDRCHHCRVCRTCVLKMDHHCPWIYNCVGFGNVKYFFLLLLYSVALCHMIGWTMFASVKTAMDMDSSFCSMFLLLFGETLTLFLGILLSCFFGFHVWLCSKAMTTIEFCEKQLKQSGYSYSVYNRGAVGNVKEILGPQPLLWLLPVSPPTGDGLSFISEASMLSVDMEAGLRIRSQQHKKASRQTKKKEAVSPDPSIDRDSLENTEPEQPLLADH